MKNKLLICFLILPVLIPILMIIFHGLNGGHEWRINIKGYDPRDLLRGQYIQFRYDFGVKQKGKEKHLCLNGSYNNPTIKPIHDLSIINVKYPCAAVIKNYKSYNSKRMRFYIPEAIAKKADKLVRNNTEDISAGIVIRDDSIILKNLYYKDHSIVSYLEEKR